MTSSNAVVWRYRAGPHLAVIGPTAAVLLVGDSTLGLAERIWPLLSDPSGDVEAVLDEMTHDGLAGLPPFVLVEQTGDLVRALVRGSAVAMLRLVGEEGTRSLSGHGFRSWREEVVPDVVDVVLAGGEVVEEEELWLPLLGGIVRASQLKLQLRDEAHPTSSGAHRRPAVPDPLPVAVPGRDASLTLDQSRYESEGGLEPDPESEPAAAELGSQDDEDLPDEASSVVPEPVGPPVAEPEPEDEYLELVSGMTRVGTVEDAAVRAPVAESSPAPSVEAGSSAAAAPPPLSVRPPPPPVIPPMPTSPPPRPRGPQPAPAPTNSGSPPGLISRAPFASARTSDARAARPTRQPPPTMPPTMPPSSSSADDAELTLVRVPAGGSVDAGETAAAGRLPALVCSHGHANPPEASHCRVCAEDLSGVERQWVERPVIGRLRFDGPPGVVDVRGPMVIGRAPRVDKVSGDAVPDLITVPDPDVSRSHLRVAVEGWHVMVVDLGTTNGTVVQDPAGESRRLRPDEEKMIVPGSRVVLADTTAFVFEAQS